VGAVIISYRQWNSPWQSAGDTLIDSLQYRRCAQALPFLSALTRDQIDAFCGVASWVQIPKGRDVFAEGDRTESLALVLAGTVRVYKIGETGREITLYRFGHGESCVLTANAILSHHSFPAIATVEADVEAVTVPAASLREWVGVSPVWREFVFELFSQRLSAIMSIVEEVAFRRMDARLASYLLERAANTNPIHCTHQEIAADLGSSREVVSRLLEDFAKTGALTVSRGMVELTNANALGKIAQR
jgi:CRP/FNR family transcriptional regulator